MSFHPQLAHSHNEAREPAQNIVFGGDVREEVSNGEVIFVRVCRWATPVFGDHRFRDPHQVLLEGCSTSAIKNCSGIVLAIVGRHRSGGGKKLLSVACQETVKFGVLRAAHLENPLPLPIRDLPPSHALAR